MTRILNTTTIVCDGCGVEIQWAPVVVNGRMYCCRDCAEGRPCQCDYPPEEPQESSALPVVTTS